MYDSRYDNMSGISCLYDYLEDFEDYIKAGNAKKYGFRGHPVEGLPKNFTTFNTQVMAPYLLKFTMVPNHFGKPEHCSKLGINLKGHQTAMAQAYAISIIARHYDVDTGFCGCVIRNDENKNLIWYDDVYLIFFVGLGYTDENCYKSREKKLRPSFEDICTWE